MAKKVYEEENIRAIADKIREKTSGDSTYKTSEMPGGIDEACEQAYGTGYGAGIVDGEASGYNDGYNAGQQAEYDRFWDSYQNNGAATDYQNAFSGKLWNNETFKPKYDIKTTSAYMMFRYAKITGDLTQILKDLNVTLDFSLSNNFNYCFQSSNITKIGVLDLSGITSSTNTTDSMISGSLIEEIELVKTNKVQFAKFSKSAFTSTNLKEVRFDGVIADDIFFDNSPELTHDSLMSIINALKNFVEKKTLRYAYGTYGSWDVAGCDTDPKGYTWNVTEATLSGTTLTCKCYCDEWTDVTFTVTGIDIAEEDVANIKTIMTNVMDWDEETWTFYCDIVITTEGVTGSATLDIGTTNLAKLTDEEKAIVTNKGWVLV